MLFAVLSLALAGDIEVELARAAILEARPSEAMQVLEESRHSDWFALRLYLRACAHAGLMPLCDVEYSDRTGWEGFVWRWHHAERAEEVVEVGDCEGEVCRVGLGWTEYYAGSLERAAQAVSAPIQHPNGWRLKLRVARKGEDDALLATTSQRFMARVQNHPQVLSELFIGGFEGRATRRARKRAIRHVQGLKSPSDAVVYRQLRFAMSAGLDDWAESLADSLEARGHSRPATHKPYNAAMERTLGTMLAQTATPRAKGPTAPDRLAVAAVLARNLRRSDRLEDAAAMWSDVRGTDDSSSAASDHASILLALGRAAEALEVSVRAMELAASGDWDDVGRLDAARWRSELAEALAIHARARAATGVPAGGYAALAAALIPSERMERLEVEVGPPADGAPAPVGPAVRAARLLTDETAALWSAHGDWLTSEQPQFAAVARLHAEALGGAKGPAHEAVRGAFESQGEQAPDAVEVGSRFPLARLGLEPGRPTIVSAWASWCGPCRQELPQLDALVGTLRDAGADLNAVALSVDQQEVVFRRSVARFGFQALTVERSPELGANLQTGALPTLWLIDAQGVVTGIRVGYSEDALSSVQELVESAGRP